MHCVEPSIRRSPRWLGLAVLALILSGCSNKHLPPPEAPPEAVKPAARPHEVKPATGLSHALPPAPPVRTRADLELQAARRIAAANHSQVYLGKPPDVLLAVPVLQVELHGDGRVKRIHVLRYPRQARDTVDLAIAAVHRAAPYGNVQRMPEPWMFVETFLFNNDRHFKPRALD